MDHNHFAWTNPFISKPRAQHIPITPIKNNDFKQWLKKQNAVTKAQIDQSAFTAKPKQTMILRDAKGNIVQILLGLSTPQGPYDFSAAADTLSKQINSKTLESLSFYIDTDDKDVCLYSACAAWALGLYRYDAFKAGTKAIPALLLPKNINKKNVLAQIESIILTRNLINAPANIMGPEDIETAARDLAKQHQAKISVIADKALITKNFPMIFAVGDSSPRRPRLIDLQWGNPKHRAVTLVGKGVAFDTGGLDLKPSAFMRLMKKDMGGAAHALGLAHWVMSNKLPIFLRVLIPAVENSVSGQSFRPGDVFKSRKGLTIENTNTDAEGRLILSDALTYACEAKPDLVIDFATLTGSARAALGHDIPACFSNREDLANALKNKAMQVQDPVWPMPLWQPYKKIIEGNISDLINSPGQPGDLIYSALFLQEFIDPKIDWIHLDVFAWEASGFAGRPAGGADTALRAVYAFLEGL